MNKKKFQKYKGYLDNGYFGEVDNYSTTELVSDIYKTIEGSNRVEIETIKKEWKSFLKSRSQKNSLSLYTHIPYCKNKCSYCNTGSKNLNSEEEIEEYIEKIIKFYHYFSDTFEKEIFDNLYIGGGTPNILSKSLLDKLLSELHSSFDISKTGERTVENNPVNSTLGKLKILKKHNISRVSFGVQSFNERVLKLNNRGEQTEEIVEKTIADAKKVGFECINIDLMIGLYGDSEETIINSFEKAMSLNPDSISMYLTQPVPGYLLNTYDNITKKEFFKRRKRTVNNFFDKAIKLAEEYNYYTPEAKGVKKHKHLNNADSIVFNSFESSYNPETRYVANPIHDLTSIFAVGYDSSSTILERMRYSMQDDLTDEVKDYKFKTIDYNSKKEMLKNIIVSFSSVNYVNFKYFESKHNVKVQDKFHKQIKKLEEENALEIKEDGLHFKANDPEERFIYLLYFFDEEIIKNYIEIKKEQDQGEEVGELICDKDVEKKIKNFNSRLNDRNSTIVEGNVISVSDKEIEIITKNKKKKSITLTDKMLVVELFMRGGSYKTFKISEIQYKDLQKNDSLLICSEDQGSHLFIKKITVKE